MIRKLAVLAIATVLGVMLTGQPLWAAPENQPVISFGVADMQKVLDGYQEFQQSQEEFRAFRSERLSQLQEMAQLGFLNEKEYREYQDLKKITAPTEEQKKRAQELLDLAEGRGKKMADLENKDNLTEDEQKRMEELRGSYDKSRERLEALQKKVDREIDEKNRELSERLNKKMTSAAEAVALKENLAFVLAKDVVLFGGKDITDKLLAKLNEKEPEKTK